MSTGLMKAMKCVEFVSKVITGTLQFSKNINFINLRNVNAQTKICKTKAMANGMNKNTLISFKLV